MSSPDSNASFDRAMRGVHRDALARVSADTRRRLRDASHAATMYAPQRRTAWPVASACAAVVAVAIGWSLHAPPPAGSPQSRVSHSTSDVGRTAPAATAATEIPAALAALEESPDFYLWLASNEAALNLLEQRP